MKLPLYSRSSDLRNLVLGQGCEGQWVLSHLYEGEAPDAVWFILGTAIHAAIEAAILDELDLDEALGVAHVEKLMMLDAVRKLGVVESKSARSKRGLETLDADIDRMVAAWFRDVHPDSPDRRRQYNDYDWPPRVEHEIQLPGDDPGLVLYTTIDAIFEGGPEGMEVAIVDWKSGSKTSVHEAQLHTYAYGGNKEGWRNPKQRYVGWFHHLDAKPGKSMQQQVFEYVGNGVVAAWLRATYLRKRAMLDTAEVVFNPDWWCKTCRVREFCPAMGEGDPIQIVARLEKARLLDEPERNAE